MKPIPDTIFYTVLCRFDPGEPWHQCGTFISLEDARIQLNRDRSGSDREFMLAELRHSFSSIAEDSQPEAVEL